MVKNILPVSRKRFENLENYVTKLVEAMDKRDAALVGQLNVLGEYCNSLDSRFRVLKLNPSGLGIPMENRNGNN